MGDVLIDWSLESRRLFISGTCYRAKMKEIGVLWSDCFDSVDQVPSRWSDKLGKYLRTEVWILEHGLHDVTCSQGVHLNAAIYKPSHRDCNAVDPKNPKFHLASITV